MNDPVDVVALILAAGRGTRMKSDMPKVLHPVAGKAMVEHVVDRLHKSGIQDICMVISADLEPWQEFLCAHPEIRVCIQKVRNGTAGAVGSAAGCLGQASDISYASHSLVQGEAFRHEFVLICAGDTPALESSDLQQFVRFCSTRSADVGVLGMEVPDPYGYGRLLTEKDGSLIAIVEEKEADDEQRRIRLCNSGVIYARVKTLFHLLEDLSACNQQEEYYLTDIVARAHEQGYCALAFRTRNWQNFQGVNTPDQLSRVEQFLHSGS
ncbi:MAG: NTP transferase domain-containing protein [Deltaproteobacteria bacterium]|nr:NTP transferase domain-containing protein [Deltaproteobacteria bacterium]